MDVPEQWGHRADAVVACLMASCALALALCGLWVTYRCHQVMPFLLLFFWRKWDGGHGSLTAYGTVGEVDIFPLLQGM